MKSFNLSIFQFSNQKGYLLVEMMLALSLLTIGFLGFLGLISRSTSMNRVVSDQFTANYLSSEGIEVIKNLIDSNIIQSRPWNERFGSERCFEVDYKTMNVSGLSSIDCQGGSSNPIKFDSSTGVFSYTVGQNSAFYRTIHIVPVNSDEIKVNSTVKWTGRGGIKNEINLENHFFNWRP
ncbi:MAG: prepilin-type N-terminal cleavage/methylation domain-containing protein [Patescibacteria group bacterium]|nr:prepilin-type N-terminal cleavage/methylation domain-containing protein [Patescibacteria group bacterium]